MSSSSDSGALALVYRIEASARLGADRRAQPGRDLLLARVRGEFSEMPCLSLTIPQAMRLFGLREDICRRVLGTLVADGVLWKRHDERYVSRAIGI
jgi:hypothetical protein